MRNRNAIFRKVSPAPIVMPAALRLSLVGGEPFAFVNDIVTTRIHSRQDTRFNIDPTTVVKISDIELLFNKNLFEWRVIEMTILLQQEIEIEEKRNELLDVSKRYGFLHSRTIRCSQELDKLLNQLLKVNHVGKYH